MIAPATLFEKIWASHVVSAFEDGRAIVHIDRHLLQETTCEKAFDGLGRRGLSIRAPDLTFAVIDHSVATTPGRTAASFPPTRNSIEAMQRNCGVYGVELFDIDDERQGIVHVISPELGIALPGCTLVCADSHTATCGGLGSWAWGIGTTQVLHVLATQTLIQRRPKTMRVSFTGRLPAGVFAKDLVLYLIGRHGTAAGTGHVVEYSGEAIRSLPIEARLTICNMSIEFGARSGLIAPDDSTIEYLAGRPFAPRGADWDSAVQAWRALPSDDDASYDTEIAIDCTRIRPQVSWGTSPQDMIAIDETIPAPDAAADPERRRVIERALAYMALTPGQRLEGLPIDYAFIGSCTNARLSDLQEAAAIIRGRHVPQGVTAIVVPGSTQVKRQAEAIGLDRVFRDAGFEWRESGCSMCVAGNGDMVPPGQRSISTTNRNFESRQGPGSRTHLASPAMVAAAAVTGRITDVRRLMG
ncbi:MAG TPA: 3-isopropylmalate dehydratase large subunit [Stellaceae bacterium]|nr:3-isopropylmalate dehydratase large subunit [Stellaceae bacterium]